MSKYGKIKVKVDKTKELDAAVLALKSASVLVGIPAANSGTREEGGNFGNAAILALNEFGSAVNNIPPRPVMQIGLKRANPEIVKQFKMLAKDVLDGKDTIDKRLNNVGMIASNSIKNVINDQIGIEKPKASTIKARERKGYSSTLSLLVTGQLRNAITWVIRKTSK